MSDETIQYITTDYLIEVDGGEPAPAPIEYIVELGQVGVQGIPGEKGEPGFSPTVGYILNDNTFKINITNQDGVTQTPNLYDYFADKNGYLKVDGSNANNPITINGIQLQGATGTGEGIRIYRGTSYNSIFSPAFTGGGEKDFEIDYGTYGHLWFRNSLGYASLQYKGATLTLENDKLYYGGNSASNEIATIGNIGNGTITLTQGGVTKGTFTTNQSGNTTIDLDAGGGSITNPLTLTSTDGTRSLTLGINNSNNKIQSTYNFISGGSTFSSSIYLLAGKTDPITLTDDNYGKYTIGLNIDDDTIKVNQDGQLYAVGGGTTYTEGTGIDITGGVISIDTDVVAQLSDIPDVSNFVTNSSLTTTLQNYVLSSSLASVATSGSYTDLLNKPTIPTNSDYVDLTTDQTIGGTKTFSNDQKFGGMIYFNGSSNAQGVVHRVGTTRKGLVVRNNQFETVYVGNTYDALQLSGSGTRPTYYANSTSKDIAFTDDIPSLTNYVTNTDYATTSVGGVVKVDGSTITVNNGVISATPARNIGEIVQSTIPLTDAGLHLLDGSLISGSGSYADFVTYIAGLVNDYPDLFETEANWQTSVATYGVCGKFVYDSTNNTVRLPKITGIIEGTVDATALGDLVQAGLPNITGTFGANFTQGNFFNRGSGAFGGYREEGINTTVPQDSTYPYSTNNMWDFYASRSSSIYGNSTTVQPQTIKAFIYIVIATFAKTDIQVDIDEIATDLNGKANTDLNNITTTGKSASANWGVPSATVDVTYTSANHPTMNGTTFTNTTRYPCYLCIEAQSSGANCIVYAKNISAGVTNTTMGNSGWVIDTSVPVANGQQCQFYVYVPSGTVTWTASLHRMRGGL